MVDFPATLKLDRHDTLKFLVTTNIQLQNCALLSNDFASQGNEKNEQHAAGNLLAR